jgi:hypothetical protein
MDGPLKIFESPDRWAVSAEAFGDVVQGPIGYQCDTCGSASNTGVHISFDKGAGEVICLTCVGRLINVSILESAT